ncbi:MAG TPA: ATP-binding cassette domain-containing protein [Candidatus Limnocylindria bacterium]|nr:ATP-binding cassette domain-containing protein [Candidatus Limnocylindria bacterium]
MITVENLVKEFGPKKAVNNVTFTVQRGEILGFLGPNGAGKSTTMRMITGFFPPTSGRVKVGGHDLAENPIEAKKLLGYLPEAAPCYSDMTVRGFLGFCAEMRGLKGAAKDAAVDRVAGLCFLESVLHQSVDTLSKGYRHRTCFAQSIIHDPEVLVLDEPTDGLDPNQKHEVRQLIKRMGEKKAIIFSTHILEEVEAVCSRAIIIDRGTVVANGTPAELKARAAAAGSVTLRVHGTAAETVKARLGSLMVAGKVTVSTVNNVVSARVFPRDKQVNGELARAVAELTAKEGWRFDELHTEEGRLDDVFRTITLPDTVKATND